MVSTTVRTFLGIGLPDSGETTLSNASVVSSLSETKPTRYLKFVDITSFPSLKGENEPIDITTMSNKQRVEKNGLQGAMSGDFGSYLVREDYENALALKQQNGDGALYHWCVFFEDGKMVFDWIGSFDIGIGEGELASAVPVTVHTSTETEPSLRVGYDGAYADATKLITVTQRSQS